MKKRIFYLFISIFLGFSHYAFATTITDYLNARFVNYTQGNNEYMLDLSTVATVVRDDSAYIGDHQPGNSYWYIIMKNGVKIKTNTADTMTHYKAFIDFLKSNPEYLNK